MVECIKALFEDDVNDDVVLGAVRRSMPFSRAYKVVHQHVDANDGNSFERH